MMVYHKRNDLIINYIKFYGELSFVLNRHNDFSAIPNYDGHLRNFITSSKRSFLFSQKYLNAYRIF